VRVFGIDPGSIRTGYGCVESDGRRHRLVACGVIATKAGAGFADKLLAIHRGLAASIADARPDCIAIENVFHSANARSALLLGHARGSRSSRPSKPACRWWSTHPPRSSARWSATGARRSRRSSG